MKLVRFPSTLGTLFFLGTFSLGLGAGCGSSEDVPIGEVDNAARQGVTCDVEACGERPGVPAEVCADGSNGGFTGRCLGGAEGRCAWEVLTCSGGPSRPAPGTDDEGQIVAVVSALFQTKCVNCHGNDHAYGGLENIFDVDTLRERNLIGDTARTSHLVTILALPHPDPNSYDPITLQPVLMPTRQELSYVNQWLDLGAPPLRPR
jgi:hypothetical protein